MVPEIIETATGVVKVSGLVVDTISLVAEKLEKWNRIKAETSSLVRLLYLEVCKNSELLEVLVDLKDKSVQWNDPRIQFFIQNFETSVTEMVLMGSQQEAAFQKLEQKGRLTNVPDLAGEAGKNTFQYVNVLQALRFVYVKMDLLRKITKAETGDDLLVHVRVIQRLRNIQARLVLVKKILLRLDEVKNIG